MRRTEPNSDMPVDEIMRRWPPTIRLFLRHRMVCVGCPIGVFHTVAEACDAHGFDRESFEAQLRDALQLDAAAEQSPVMDAPGTAGLPPAGRCGT